MSDGQSRFTPNELNLIETYRNEQIEIRQTMSRITMAMGNHDFAMYESPNLKSIGQLIRLRENLEAGLKALNSI